MPTRTFSGRFSSLASISEFIAETAEDTDFSPSEIYTVKLAVDEACTNIIEHAYGGEGQGDIQCTCETSKNQMTITLCDRGKTLEPEHVPEPNFDVPLEALQTRGAGLFFMRKLMDEVRFKFDPKKGNVLVMVKRKQV
jgi:serine/threonine-protein kinase RsbW